MNSVAAQVLVRGLVQGVGFRYFVCRAARVLKVTGWVRNQSDGCVEIFAEGDRGMIEELISQLRVGPSFARVTDVVVEWKTFTGKYDQFEITG